MSTSIIVICALLTTSNLDPQGKRNNRRTERSPPLGDNDGSQLLYQLFADNTRLFLEMTKDNFKAAMEVVSTYTRILGACLNLENLTIVQLDDSPEPTWLWKIDCKIAKPDKMIVYLGSPIEHRLSIIREMKFILGKVQKRLSHYANRLLTMEGRLTLMKHVLYAIPVFHLMTLKLLKDGFGRLEGLCREFMWGKND